MLTRYVSQSLARVAFGFALLLVSLGVYADVDTDISFTAENQSLQANSAEIYRMSYPSGSITGWRVFLNPNGVSSRLTLAKVTGTSPQVIYQTDFREDHRTIFVPADSQHLESGEEYTITIESEDEQLTYTIHSEPLYMRELAWDSGNSVTPQIQMSQPNSFGGDYLYRITAQTPARGIWRTALDVTAGEADIRLSRNEDGTGSSRSADLEGSDGIFLKTSDFSANQQWYVRVSAQPGAEWNLYSGDIFIHDLGTVAEQESSAAVVIPPERVLYFNAAIDNDLEAWRLWGRGTMGVAISVEKETPAPITPTADFDVKPQALVVPDYLESGNYYISVQGIPGTQFEMVSQVHEILQPEVLLDSQDRFAFTLEGQTDDDGFGYLTYRIEIPEEASVWQVNAELDVSVDPDANVDLYVRPRKVPNENNNLGLSEAPGDAIDSVTHSDNLLSGIWYITVKGHQSSFGFSLTSSEPEVTELDISSGEANNPLANAQQAGWRFYRLTGEIPLLTGPFSVPVLGWQTELSNAGSESRIALRSSRIPSTYKYRSGSTSTRTYTGFDHHSDTGLLQMPGMQNGIWYLGVYNGEVALGEFNLANELIYEPPEIGFENDELTTSSQQTTDWEFFEVSVPEGSGVLGWDLRLIDINQGAAPRMVVAKNVLPKRLASEDEDGRSISPGKESEWQNGWSWLANQTWSRRSRNPDGSTVGGKILSMGMGSPLVPGKYYIGVKGSGSVAMDYTLQSRGIGDCSGCIPVRNLSFDGSHTGGGLAAREVAYYKVTVPEGAKNWGIKVTPDDSEGDVLMAIRHGALPNIEANASNDSTDDTVFAGTKRDKVGAEYFYKYHEAGANLIAGDYYIAVISEGRDFQGNSEVGDLPIGFTIESLGDLSIDTIGTLTVAGGEVVRSAQSLSFGEQKAYGFNVDPSVTSFEVELQTTSGDPVYSIVSHAPGLGWIPEVGSSPRSSSRDDYDAEETGSEGETHYSVMTFNDPAQSYTLVVAAGDDGEKADSLYNLVVRTKGHTDLDLIGGTASVSGQVGAQWRYFRVEVPEETRGWYLRLTNVAEDTEPQMVVRRTSKPTEFKTDSQASGSDVWPEHQSWSSARETIDGISDKSYQSLLMDIDEDQWGGVFYVGISSRDDKTLSYTLESYGVGDQPNTGVSPWSVTIQDVPVESTQSVSGNVQHETFEVYRVRVPEDSLGWHFEINETQSNVLALIRQGSMPNGLATAQRASDASNETGTKWQHEGDEFFYKYPDQGNNTITAGDYYVVVYGHKGEEDAFNNSSYQFKNLGLLEVEPIPADLSGANVVEDEVTGEIRQGQQFVHLFEVTETVANFSMRFKNLTGPETMLSAYFGTSEEWAIPSINSARSGERDEYDAEEGGYSSDVESVSGFVAEDVVGYIAVTVTAREDLPNGYTLQLFSYGSTDLDFNGGSTGRFLDSSLREHYKVVVPDDPNLLGWDLRLRNTDRDNPEMEGIEMALRRDQFPLLMQTSTVQGGRIYEVDNWPTGATWLAEETDWTNRARNEEGEEDSFNRLSMGVGSPLEPGTYYITVRTAGSGINYTLDSFGIGKGTPAAGGSWSSVVRTLPAGGEVAGVINEPRGIDYFEFEVPEGQSSFALELIPDINHEAMLAVAHQALPNIKASKSTKVVNSKRMGTLRQKDGSDYFYLQADETGLIPAGTYYAAVISEGQSPVGRTQVGTGAVRYTIRNIGEMPINGSQNNSQPIPMVTASQPLVFTNQSQDYGSQKAFRFEVAPGVNSMQLKLRNRVGDPIFALLEHNGEPWRIPGIGNAPSNPHVDDYDAEEAIESDMAHYETLNISYPSGVYTVVVAASKFGNLELGAEYDLEIEAQDADVLAFHGGRRSQMPLGNGQIHLYRVDVPEEFDGEAVNGWLLNLDATAGEVKLRVRKEFFPEEDSDEDTLVSELPQTVVAGEILSSGTWYLEISSEGIANYTLESFALLPERTWSMPGIDSEFNNPAFLKPDFADSGTDEFGLPIINPNTNTRGKDLRAGFTDYYRVLVPEDSEAILKTHLTAFNEQPELYIGEGLPPVLGYNFNERRYESFDRKHIGEGNLTGHWVPLDARVDKQLPAGVWWIGVKAPVETDVQYRLELAAINVQTTSGASSHESVQIWESEFGPAGAVDQELNPGDMRYYRVSIPQSDLIESESAPLTWSLNLVEREGANLSIYLREDIPPGFGETESSLIDWEDDNTRLMGSPYVAFESAGTHDIQMPPLEPGKDYYIGVYAHTNSRFDLQSEFSDDRLVLDGVLDFRTGVLQEIQLPPGSEQLYRIDVPADAARWKHLTLAGSGIRFYLHQGTVPPRNSNAHWLSSQPSAELNRYLLDAEDDQNGFPWQPNHSFYLSVVNEGNVGSTYSFAMNGRLLSEDDEDGDDLPDWWERAYLDLSATRNGDSDGDGLSNYEEFELGTRPDVLDTDGDGMPDGWEVEFGLNPLVDDAAGDLDGDGSSNLAEYLAGTNPDDETDISVIYGYLSPSRVDVTSDWTEFPTAQSFTDPVVITSLLSYNDSAPAVVQLDSVSNAGFNARVRSADYVGGAHGDETFSYFMIEAGRASSTNNSLVWEAGRVDLAAGSDWQEVAFTQSFTAAPKVLVSLQTAQDESPVYLRVRNVTTTGFEVAMMEEELSQAIHGAEVLGYFALLSGSEQGNLEAITGNSEFFRLRETIQPSGFVQFNQAALGLLEEQSSDDETLHFDESIHLLYSGDKVFATVVSDNDPEPVHLRIAMQDADGDGIPDVLEVDVDGDLMDDDWEDQYVCVDSSVDDATQDPDGDNVINFHEFIQQSNPCVTDTDNDGVDDDEDEAPTDPEETRDNDGDGIGDGKDPDDDNDLMPDSFEELYPELDPLVADGHLDIDGDNLTSLEEYQSNPRTHPNNPDSDGDQVNDDVDAFPLNPNESVDADGDGLGDANEDSDDDNDGVEDTEDRCPNDPLAYLNTDNDSECDFYDLDDDNDGISDEVEEQYPDQLDPKDASDADQDFDGDGISNRDEANGGFDLTRDDQPPTCVAPADILMDATADRTPVTLGEATGVDGGDESRTVTVSPSRQGSFRPGAHTVVWSCRDEFGNTAQTAQLVRINPLLTLPTDGLISEANALNFCLRLNGDAAIYPVTIPFTVSGTSDETDYEIGVVDEVVIASGTNGCIRIDAIADGVTENDETLVLTFGNASNAKLEGGSVLTVTLTDRNVAPEIELVVLQGGNRVTTISTGAGEVIFRAVISDSNNLDTHTVDWSRTQSDILDIADLVGNELRFNPAGIDSGGYGIEVAVTDSGMPALTDSEKRTVIIISGQVVATDSDGDGIIDEFDSVEAPERLQTIRGNNSSYLLAVREGLKLSLGEVASGVGQNQALVSLSQIRARFAALNLDESLPVNGGYVDLTISQIPASNSSVALVTPLREPIAAGARLRILRLQGANAGWQDFDPKNGYQLRSAQGNNGVCPPPGSSSYVTGLQQGSSCLELVLVNDGEYDSELSSRGTMTVTFGLVAPEPAPEQEQEPRNTFGGGGGGGGAFAVVLLLPLFLLLFYRRMTFKWR